MVSRTLPILININASYAGALKLLKEYALQHVIVCSSLDPGAKKQGSC